MEFHVDLVGLVLGLIGFIAWLVRLEYKTNQNEKDSNASRVFLEKEIESVRVEAKREIAEVARKQDDLSTALWKEISEMNKSLARIEGRLSSENKH